jgi:Fe-S-cluster containining protein
MNDVVAVITLDSQDKKIIDLKLAQKQFRFKCKQCATLCCKLGGPVLTRKDTELIEAAGHPIIDFLEPTKSEGASAMYGSLKSREDGSCIFLQQDTERDGFKCGIYDFRPTLCRLYPFSFERLDTNRIALRYIPCCMGLNNQEGKVLDREYVSSHLLEPLLEAMELHQKG